MHRTDTYREQAPPAAWRATVACRWAQSIGPGGRAHRVVPDGCADVIVGFDGAPVVVGVADEAVVHDLAAGSSCVGLRLRAVAVRSVLGVPADELRNLTVPLDDVVGSARARALVDATVDGRPVAALEVAPPERAVQAVALLATSSVDAAAEAVGLSGRQLRRLFHDEVGVGPKVLQRVLRLQRFLADEASPLADAALRAGYADQAHLTREVTRLCGLPPAALRVSRTAGRAAPLAAAGRRPGW